MESDAKERDEGADAPVDAEGRAMLRFPLKTGDPPPLWTMEEGLFEEMCRCLLEVCPDLRSASLHGRRGQKDYGVDVIAYIKGTSDIAVAQCKCCEEFTEGDIKKVSNVFLANWDTLWRERRVKRFILCVACDLGSQKVQTCVHEQVDLFVQQNIEYTAWDRRTITNKLGPHPHIVGRCFDPPEPWQQIICGPQFPVVGPAPSSGQGQEPGASTFSDAEFLSLSSAHGDSLTESLRRKCQEWDWHGAREEAERIRKSPEWNALPAEARSEILATKGALLLDLSMSVDRARELSKEALATAETPQAIRFAAILARMAGETEKAWKLADSLEGTEKANLRARLHLEAGQVAECIREIKDLRAVGKENDESLRLESLAYLLQGRLSDAYSSIKEALRRDDKRLILKHTLGMIQFYRALSPAAWPSRPAPWPQPVEWFLVRRDEKSLESLREATGVFEDLASKLHGDASRPGHLLPEVWRLACLACEPDKTEEAEEFAGELLSRDRFCWQAVFWALDRGYRVDLSPLRETLSERVKSGAAEIGEAIALVVMDIHTDRQDDALATIENAKKIFQASGGDRAYDFWRAQIFSLSERYEESLSILAGLEQTSDVIQLRMTTMRRAFANGQREEKELVALACETARDTHDPGVLLDACRILAHCGEWQQLQEHSARLPDLVKTVEAVHLQAGPLHELRDYEGCLKVLEAASQAVPESDRDSELIRMRASCLENLGRHVEALAVLKGLEATYLTVGACLQLADLGRRCGDALAIEKAALRLVESDDAEAADLLQVSDGVTEYVPHLARAIWRALLGKQVEDTEILKAIDLGGQAGAPEEEIRPFWDRLMSLEARGHPAVQNLVQPQALAVLREKQQHAEDFAGQFMRGELPAHLFAAATAFVLTRYFHSLPLRNSASPDASSHVPIFIRYGARPGQVDGLLASADCRLHLDPTALLVLNHLDLLDVVEEHFGPLYVPDQTLPFLEEERRRLESPGRTPPDGAEEIVALRNTDLISVERADVPGNDRLCSMIYDFGPEWTGLFQLAQAQSGIVVDPWFPRQTAKGEPPESLPEDVWEHSATPFQVTLFLNGEGEASAEVLERVRGEADGKSCSEEPPALLKQRAPLFLTFAAACHFARLGLLRQVCDVFRVAVLDEAMARASETPLARRETTETVEWLKTLKDRLHGGITEGGRYQLLPSGAISEEDEASPDRSALVENPLGNCLRSLSSSKLGDRACVCFADRYLTSFQNCNGTPVVDILQVLEALVGRGALSRDRSHEIRARLRSEGFRYVPLERTELLCWLRASSMDGGHLKECAELATIRRYMAACTLQWKNHKSRRDVEVATSERDERRFLTKGVSVVSEARIDLWMNSECSVEEAQFLSEWLTTNLYCDALTLWGTWEEGASNPSTAEATAFDLVGHIFLAVYAISPDEQFARDRLKAYLEWLVNRVAPPWREDASDILASVAQSVWNYAQTVLSSGRHKEEETLRLIVGSGLLYLPDRLRDEIFKNPQVGLLLGVRSGKVVRVGDHTFGAEDFYLAARDAYGGASAELAAWETDAVCTLELSNGQDGGKRLILRGPDGEPLPVASELHLRARILTAPSEESRALLLKNKSWYDGPTCGLAEAADAISGLNDPMEREEALASRLGRNAQHY